MAEVPLNNKAKLTEHSDYGRRDIAKEFEDYECEIEGEIPTWINGTIYKQAGGAFGEKHNQLDGLAHLASFRLENGRAFFTNKFMRTKDYANFINTGKRSWDGVSTSFDSSIWSSIKQKVKNSLQVFSKQTVPKSQIKYHSFNPNVTTWLLDNGRIVAAQTENGGLVCQVDPKTLTTIGELKTMIPGTRRGQMIQTPAHYFREGSSGGYHLAVELKIDYSINPTFTFLYNIYHGDTAPFKLVHQDEVCKLKWTEKAKANKVLADRPSYMHGVAVSENFFINIETSCKFDLVKVLTMDMSEGFFGMTPFVDTPIAFTIFRRIKTDTEEKLEKVARLVGKDALMVWHVANCFETNDGNIVIETSCSKVLYKDPSFFGRFVLNLATEEVTFTHLLENHEFPIVNPGRLMKEHENIFLLKGDLADSMSLAKYKFTRTENSLDDSPELMFDLYNESHYIVSEPCFVEVPDGKDDEGFVLLMVADQEKEESFMALINGETGSVVARIKAPEALNIGLHTVYIPAAGLDMYRSKM